MHPEAIKAVRDFAIWTFIRAAGIAVAVIAIVWVLIPNLINAHNDAYVILAIALGVAAVIGGGWLVVSLWLSVARFKRTLSNIEETKS
jgi:uncharacterized membrane protein